MRIFFSSVFSLIWTEYGKLWARKNWILFTQCTLYYCEYKTLFSASENSCKYGCIFLFFSFSVVIGKSYYFGFQDEKSVLLYMLNQNSSLLLLKSHYKSSRPQLFYKMSVLKKFAKFTGKYLCLRLFFKKYAGWRPTTLTKIHPSRGVFLGISQNLQEYSSMERLLLL